MKNRIFTAFFVVYLLVSPGPLGIRPAHANPAALAVVAVGALISATLVAGAGVYSQSVYDASKDAADAVSGAISRDVLVAKMVAVGGQQIAYGVAGQVKLDYDKVCDWVLAHPLDFPLLSVPVKASNFDQTTIPFSGEIIKLNGLTYKVLAITDMGYFISNGGFPPSYWISTYTQNIGGSIWKNPAHSPIYFDAYWDFQLVGTDQTRMRHIMVSTQLLSATPTTFPQVRDKTKFAPAYSHSAATQAEIDKLIFGNPAAVIAKPASFTAAQVDAAIAKALAAQAAAVQATAESKLAADPTNTALQVAADQAKAVADKAAIESTLQDAKVEATPDDPPKTDTPPPAGPALDQDLQIDLSPFLGLKDKAMGKFPFSAVASLGSIFSGLTADPVTPSMDMPMPWGLPVAKISLSRWDDFAVKWRLLVAMMFHASCIYAIVRRYA